MKGDDYAPFTHIWIHNMAVTKKERASNRTRDKILSTATRLLLAKGSTVSISTIDVCSKARITRPTLYHYFGSKRNLLSEVFADILEKSLRPYLSDARGITDPLDRLTYMIRAFAWVMYAHPELGVLIHDSSSMKDECFNEVRKEWKSHYALLRDTMTQLKSSGVINKELKTSWTALFVLGMLTWMTHWFDRGRTEDIDRIADLAVELVLNALVSGKPDKGVYGGKRVQGDGSFNG